MRTDVHAHTTYSDGSDLSAMIEAAEAAGVDGLGLTDHCILTADAFGRHETYDLDETYERRREHIDRARETTDLTLYDAAELSYVPEDSDRIAEFLTTADFDYTIGSVHFASGYDYTSDSQYVDSSDGVRREAVECYYDAVVELVETELFDVLGHLDLPERLETLRGHTRPSDYDRVAAALSDSRTVPELNAGRVNGSLGRLHPNPAMLSTFADRGVDFVLGTDSHRPDELRRRVPTLRDRVAQSQIDLLCIDALL
jgi:histidinol-phosphatase (PHP family)